MNERLVLRLSFVSTGAILLYGGVIASWEGAIHAHAVVVVFILVFYILAFFNLFLGVAPDSLIEKYKGLILPSLLLVLLGSAYIRLAIINPPYGTDAMALTHYASTLFIQGENPYRVTGDLAPIVERYRLPAAFVTQTLDGQYIDRLLSYPALHWLIYVPFISLGLADMRWVTLLFEVATLLLLFVKGPPFLRPIILLPIFLNPDAWLYFTTGSVTDFMWVLPVVGLALALKSGHLVRAGFLFGLACAIKQPPWLLTPFLLVLTWNHGDPGPWRQRLGRSLAFFVPTVLVFALFNAPFIFDAPGDWLTSVTYPLFAGMMPDGQGLSMLTKVGLLKLPRDFYTVSMAVVGAVLLLNYIIYFDRLKWAFWLFPAVIFWFSYRSFQNYYLYWVPLLLLALPWITEELEQAKALRFAWPRLRRLAAPLSVLLGALGLMLAAVYFQNAPGSALDIAVLRMEDPRATGRITDLEIRVVNSSPDPIQPRFSVMWDSYPRYWETTRGPTQLEGRSEARFHARTDKEDNSILYSALFVVRVNNADATYYYRTEPLVATVSGKETDTSGW